MSEENKIEFIELLKECSKSKDEASFMEKLGKFYGRAGEGVFMRVVANLFNPINLQAILANINL